MNKIPYKERCEVYDRAISRFGKTTQCIVAIEEMSEVIKALTKYLRARHKILEARILTEWGGIPCLEWQPIDNSSIIEEVADATIMLEQLRLIFGINDEVCEAMDAKIERLRERVSG